MVKVVAKHYLKKDQIETYKTLAQELIEKTRKFDEGCIEYDLYEDVDDPSILTIIETWSSMENLNKHMESDHFKQLIPKMAGLYSKATEANTYRKV